MTEWLIQQQGPLCLVLVTLMVMEHFFTVRIGIRLMYKLWWMVPVVLLMANLPIPVISLPANSFTRYIVSGSVPVNVSQNAVWLGLWVAGASCIALYLISQYAQLARSVSKPMAGMKNTIGAELMPAITDMMGDLSAWMRENRDQVSAFASTFFICACIRSIGIRSIGNNRMGAPLRARGDGRPLTDTYCISLPIAVLHTTEKVCAT